VVRAHSFTSYAWGLLNGTRSTLARVLPNERCSRQALFGCGYAAMVVVCLQLN